MAEGEATELDKLKDELEALEKKIPRHYTMNASDREWESCKEHFSIIMKALFSHLKSLQGGA